ncbi:nuclear transport factor 2 family protein [Thalassotalea aquiviva]|uniref:nuclear transport factor 2 family protein n=1 Tax=Thalassotalea aquiviva TaxID=3242415 RepID=UPI00352A8406
MILKYAIMGLLLLPSAGYAQNLTTKVNEYFDAQKAVEHKHSQESDVENLLSLLTDDATFEHPSFNAVQTKEEYKAGLLYYLGKYGKCDIEISNIIEGLNAVTVEYLHPCIDPQGNVDANSRKQKLVTLFEFNDEKIKLIRHYF